MFVSMIDYLGSDDLHWAIPDVMCGTGILVLAGSSGGIPYERADLFARHGALAVGMRWFGGRTQRPAPCDVPVEAFLETVDLLSARCDRVAVVGSSFGAEAALLAASLHSDIDVVVAFAPTSVVWSGYASGEWSSHWTHRGVPVPAVPFDLRYWPDGPQPSFLDLYERSLDAAPHEVRDAAAIPVERIRGQVITVAGGADLVWPSLRFAHEIADRRRRAGLTTSGVSHPEAGHRVRLPGEQLAAGGGSMLRGGTEVAAAELGRAVWHRLAIALHLDHTDLPKEPI